MNAIIIDDEKPSRIILEQLLDWHCPTINLLAKCANVDEGLASINRVNPDLVFLDIAMPNKNGFDLFKEMNTINFEVIFTTAYDEFALEAFKVHASAYLLKPIDKDLLIAAVNKIEQRHSKQLAPTKIFDLLKEMQQNKHKSSKVAIPTMEGIEYIEATKIIRCFAEGNYTRIYVEQGTVILISKSLKQVEAILDNQLFIRPHNSHLVNSGKIKKYIKGSGGQLIMDDNTIVPVSRSRKDALQNI